jgi:isoaspartyl peptidase/L-asparaginase-like protein (Ntn-hydrolase superfamily)
MTDRKFALALHGGAGPLVGRNYDVELEHMRDLIEMGRDRLASGASALDVVVEIVGELEASGLYVAGRGASPNTAGIYELDACVMDGRGRRAGAVAALVGYQSPIAAARQVMETTPHVLLVGDGAAAFAGGLHLPRIDDPAAWFSHAGGGGAGTTPSDLATGTVGCVALDRHGDLAGATSTGGVFGKLPGRVGDCPIPGSGTWADARVAVSCTGAGEMFIRAAVAAQIAHRIRFGGETLESACAAALDEVRALKGEGGLIAIDASGEIAMPFNSAGMKRAALHPDGRIEVGVFG